MAVNRRLVLESEGVLKFSEDTIPEPPPDGAIVKVSYVGVCHSDVHKTFRTKTFNPKFVFPRVLGHEISGVIHKFGQKSGISETSLKVGDNVYVYPWGHCMDCNNCRADYTYCTGMSYGEGPLKSYVYGYWKDGGYQTYLTVHRVEFLVKVPTSVGLDQAAIMTCGGLTSYNAVGAIREAIDRAIHANGSALVAVVGAGGLALWAIQIIKAFYPSTVRIIAVDIIEEKLSDAKTAGADVVHKWGSVESDEEAAENLVKVCGHPNAIIDYIGLPGVMKRCHMALHIGGTLCLIGLSGSTVPEVPLGWMVAKNVSVKGVLVGSQSQCRQLLSMVEEGKVRPPPITHVKLDDVPRVLQLLESGKQRGRAVVKM